MLQFASSFPNGRNSGLSLKMASTKSTFDYPRRQHKQILGFDGLEDLGKVVHYVVIAYSEKKTQRFFESGI